MPINTHHCWRYGVLNGYASIKLVHDGPKCTLLSLTDTTSPLGA